MKRYMFLFSITLLSIAVIYGTGIYLKNSVVDVSILVAEPRSIDNSIVCSGKIECANSHDVYANTTCIVDKICVSVGDKVYKGDILAIVEEAEVREVTKSVNTDKISIPDINYKKIYSNAELERIYKELLQEDSAKETLSSAYKSTGKKTNVISPITGVVSSVNISEKDLVDQNKSLVLVTDSEKLRITVAIEESQISEIALGQPVIITGAGFKNSEYTGRVTDISNQAEQIINPTGKETVVNVGIEMDHVGSDVKPGFTAKCKIITSNDSNKITLPYEIVRSDTTGQEYVYLYKNGCAVKTYVTTGKEYTEGFEILDGIGIGDKIITDSDCVWDRCRVNLSDREVVNKKC